MRLIPRLLDIIRSEVIGEKLVTAEDVKGIFADPVTPMRVKLPHRRDARRITVAFEFSSKVVREFQIGFGRDQSGMIREVFCCDAHTQSDLQGLVEDACVATSIALQFGARIGDLARSFGELRAEGATSGPPASVMGAIARAGATLERDIMEGRA